LSDSTVVNLTELSLRITEIFYSLQGEARSVGLPTVFVRLTGCPLRCVYCDTEYAFSGGQVHSLAQIIAQIDEFGCRRICVTGGEPLAQPECAQLLTALCDRGFEVSLETSGAISIEHIDTRVSRVMDLKTPDSGESHRNLWPNITYLTPNDQLKFVICSREDYEWARFKIDEYQLLGRVSDLLMSPSHGVVSATDLAEWMLADRLEARLQLQLHKFLWNDEPGH
jgi:7-carboxy-7-deazaguanine synthase